MNLGFCVRVKPKDSLHQIKCFGVEKHKLFSVFPQLLVPLLLLSMEQYKHTKSHSEIPAISTNKSPSFGGCKLLWMIGIFGPNGKIHMYSDEVCRDVQPGMPKKEEENTHVSVSD